MKLKEFGPPGGGARPKFYYVDPPLTVLWNPGKYSYTIDRRAEFVPDLDIYCFTSLKMSFKLWWRTFEPSTNDKQCVFQQRSVKGKFTIFKFTRAITAILNLPFLRSHDIAGPHHYKDPNFCNFTQLFVTVAPQDNRQNLKVQTKALELK